MDWQSKRRKLRGKTPKRNKGWFRPGPDPRRHQLTFEDCQRGGIRSWLTNGFFRTDPVSALLEQEGFDPPAKRKRAGR